MNDVTNNPVPIEYSEDTIPQDHQHHSLEEIKSKEEEIELQEMYLSQE
jgi:hypothetical protein